MNRVLAAIPYARFLGVTVEPRDGGLEFLLPFRDEIVGNARLPAVHGGVLGAFLELAALLRLIDESGLDGAIRAPGFVAAQQARARCIAMHRQPPSSSRQHSAPG